MRKVLHGYAKGRDGNLILVGTIPVPHSKDKRPPRERQDKRRSGKAPRSSKGNLLASHPMGRSAA